MEINKKRTLQDTQLSFWKNLIDKHIEKIEEAREKYQSTYVIKTQSKSGIDLLHNLELQQELIKIIGYRFEVSSMGGDYFLTFILDSNSLASESSLQSSPLPQTISKKNQNISKLTRQLHVNDLNHISQILDIMKDRINDSIAKTEKNIDVPCSTIISTINELTIISEKVTKILKQLSS